MSLTICSLLSGEESFESEMQKALDNIQLDRTITTEADKPEDKPNVTNTTPVDTSAVTPAVTSAVVSDNSAKFKSFTLKETTPSSVVESRPYSDYTRGISDGRPKPNISSPLTSETTKNSTNSTINGRLRSIDSDEVRVMQKVLAKEIELSAEECAKILHSTDWDVHKAIKCIVSVG